MPEHPSKREALFRPNDVRLSLHKFTRFVFCQMVQNPSVELSIFGKPRVAFKAQGFQPKMLDKISML